MAQLVWQMIPRVWNKAVFAKRPKTAEFIGTVVDVLAESVVEAVDSDAGLMAALGCAP